MQIAEKRASIFAYDAKNGGKNTPLFLEWDDAKGRIYDTSDFQHERERGYNGMTPRWIGPFTRDDGSLVKIRPAPCGSGCYCAAEFKTIRAAGAR